MKGNSKRGNNEGTIYQRADGRWTAAVTVGGGHGKQRRKYVYGRTRQEAAAKLTDVLKQVKNHEPIPSDRMTVGTFAQKWLQSVKPAVKPKTYEGYESIVRVHVVPGLGREALTGLEPSDLERFYAELSAKGLSAESVRNYHRRIHTMLESAVRLGAVTRNVAKLVNLPRVKQRNMPMLNPEEVRTFISAATGSRLEALFVLAVTCGARQGELLGLTWDDVDLRNGEIRIDKALQRVDGRLEHVEPKTASSVRTVALTGIATDTLRRHKTRQLEEVLKAGPAWRNEINLVFTTNVGTPLQKANITRRNLRPVLKIANLPEVIRFHDLRHIAASLALSQGLPVTVVSAMLGHANPSITMRIYAHAIPGDHRQVADAMDKLLAV